MCLCCSLRRLSPWSRPWSCSTLSEVEDHHSSLLHDLHVFSQALALAGLDQYGRLTDPMGVRMAEFPLSPMFAKMLLESGNSGCSKEIVTIAADANTEHFCSAAQPEEVSGTLFLVSVFFLMHFELICTSKLVLLCVASGSGAQEVCCG